MLCTCEKKKKNKKFDTKHFNNNKIKISVLIKKKEWFKCSIVLWSAVDREDADYICMLISMFGHQTAVPLEKIKKWWYLFFFLNVKSWYCHSMVILTWLKRAFHSFKKNACSLSCHELNEETDSIIVCVFSQTQSWIAYLLSPRASRGGAKVKDYRYF